MNRHARPVEIPAVLVDRGRLWAKRLVSHYAEGGSPNSRAVSGDRGTERNAERQAQGKIGEVAVAILFGRNPLLDVKWNLVPDGGSDLVAPCGLLVDVKTTLPPRRLIWSRTINHLYKAKRFDALVAVSIDARDLGQCWIEGWISKDRFFADKRIADGSNGLESDTWFVEKSELDPIDDLLEEDARPAIAAGRQFEFISGAMGRRC